jgi:hypothetical protein
MDNIDNELLKFKHLLILNPTDAKVLSDVISYIKRTNDKTLILKVISEIRDEVTPKVFNMRYSHLIHFLQLDDLQTDIFNI